MLEVRAHQLMVIAYFGIKSRPNRDILPSQFRGMVFGKHGQLTFQCTQMQPGLDQDISCASCVHFRLVLNCSASILKRRRYFFSRGAAPRLYPSLPLTNLAQNRRHRIHDLMRGNMLLQKS